MSTQLPKNNSASVRGESLPTSFYDSSAEFNHNLRESFPEIIGRSPSMTHTLEQVLKIARSDGSVLIHGESGTGKELIASAIHRLSGRSTGKFVPINCSAIPESLLEAELFGHEKGAFTGALTKRSGYLEMAKGGTILLDEIGDMPLRLQAKILRVLQEKQYSPIGSAEVKRTDVRIIAATNVDLQQAVKDGVFRLDLYYRLNVLPVHLPSLKDRPEDITDLMHHFLDIANTKHASQKPCYFSKNVLTTLMSYAWPGNVRELQNLVERLVVMTGGGVIEVDALPQEYLGVALQTRTPEVRRPEPIEPPKLAKNVEHVDLFKLPDEGIDLTRFIEELENSYIMQALELTGHNKNRAAQLLGLNRTTLVERIKKRKIAPLNNPSKEL
ncbi:MAG: sigma-54 interaction domain-containing protein [Oligoflexales bacterium]